MARKLFLYGVMFALTGLTILAGIELILPHFAFHRMAGLFAVTVQLCRPHLARFLPEEAIRPTAEWAARLALTYSIHPVPAVRPHDPSSVRRLVDTYVMPALASPQEPS